MTMEKRHRPETVIVRRRLSVPAEHVVPQELGLARDSRSLGAALRQIEVRPGGRKRTMLASDARPISGFHSFEADGDFVWTGGDATLPTDLFSGLYGPMELVLMLVSTKRYIDDGEQQRVARKTER